MTTQERFAAIDSALAHFNVDPTREIVELIAAINIYHHNIIVDPDMTEALRAICGDPAIFETVEAGQ